MNRIMFGDNLQGLKSLQKSHHKKVTLIYIDPPFSTNNTFRISDKRTATISMDNTTDVAYTDTVNGHEYFKSLYDRLKIAHDLLADDGSLYLHIDYKIAYEVKNILDKIFGVTNFRSSISRIKCNPKNFNRKGYGNIKDTILFYTKSDDFIWHQPRIKSSTSDRFTKKDKHGKYTTTPLHAPGVTRNGVTGKRWKGLLPPEGRHWRCSPKVLDELDAKNMIEWSKTGNPRKKIYEKDVIKKGVLMQDIWEFKDPQYPQYPTEKNLTMLEIIIKASSNRNDMVLDFYCGSGTTLLASAIHDRTFVGIDQSIEAIKICKQRLEKYEYDFIDISKHTHKGL